MQEASGHCKCSSGWAGSSCEIYVGECPFRCEKCSGPGSTECTRCVANSYLDDIDQTCTCDQVWAGALCDLYVGDCHPMCDRHCFGPGPDHCHKCVKNAHANA